MQNTSAVVLRMQTITSLLKDRALIFREVEAAQGTPEVDIHFGEWKRITAEIEALQRMGA